MKHSVYGHEVDLDPDTGRKILSEAPIRVVDVPGRPGWIGPYNKPEIQYEGEWIGLCRTDLKDDVATGICETHTPEEWREYYLGRIHYGIRLWSDGRLVFRCIDAYSDG